jgi:hypothetical protein
MHLDMQLKSTSKPEKALSGSTAGIALGHRDHPSRHWGPQEETEQKEYWLLS